MNSTSTVGATPSPGAEGSSTLAGADKQLSIRFPDGGVLSFPFLDNPPPNDVIFRSDLVTVVMNAQVPDPEESAGITTDAVQILFNRFPMQEGGQSAFVSGFVEIGHSFASINEANVPEASTWAMMLLGFAGLGYAGYRGRRSAVAAAR
jgi:hypothetical protein